LFRRGTLSGCGSTRFRCCTMTRLLLVLLVVVLRTAGQVQPINEVIADTLRQTVNIFLTNRPFAGSDPREGLLKLACVPCKLVVMVTRLSVQNVPGLGPLLTGVCTFIIGDVTTCTDQIGFIALALEFADNDQACERFWACAKAPEPEEKKKKKDEKGPRRLHPSRPGLDLPEDAIILPLTPYLNETDDVTVEIIKHLPRTKGVSGTTPRPSIFRGTIDGARSFAGGMFSSFTKMVGFGGASRPFSDSHYSRHNPYHTRDAQEKTRAGYGGNLGFGAFANPFLDFIGKKKR
ncbi:hypothetical protein PMAYCL1PPCAC_16774, partial [Pristionchus mayeri]